MSILTSRSSTHISFSLSLSLPAYGCFSCFPLPGSLTAFERVISRSWFLWAYCSAVQCSVRRRKGESWEYPRLMHGRQAGRGISCGFAPGVGMEVEATSQLYVLYIGEGIRRRYICHHQCVKWFSFRFVANKCVPVG